MSHHTPHSSVAATAHLVEAERILAALPLAKRRERDRQLGLALCNALLSVAASMLGDGVQQTITGEERAGGTP
jgi:hypothetical protein